MVISDLRSEGFPHSDIPGSTFVDNSPRLFAVYHVLRRFSAPKHPPYTLSNLNLFLYLSSRSQIFSIKFLSIFFRIKF